MMCDNCPASKKIKDTMGCNVDRLNNAWEDLKQEFLKIFKHDYRPQYQCRFADLYVMLELEILGYCRRKGIKTPKKHGLEELCGFIKIMLLSAMPIYNYLLFLCVLFYDSKKLEKIIQNKIDEAKE